MCSDEQESSLCLQRAYILLSFMLYVIPPPKARIIILILQIQTPRLREIGPLAQVAQGKSGGAWL